MLKIGINKGAHTDSGGAVKGLGGLREDYFDNSKRRSKLKTQAIKATLYHLTGETSEIMVQMPNYTTWGDCYIKCAMDLNQYIFYIATTYVQIYKFHTELGELDPAGKFVPGDIKFKETEIPIGKVFIKGTYGKWVTLAEAKGLELKGDSIDEK